MRCAADIRFTGTAFEDTIMKSLSQTSADLPLHFTHNLWDWLNHHSFYLTLNATHTTTSRSECGTLQSIRYISVQSWWMTVGFCVSCEGGSVCVCTVLVGCVYVCLCVLAFVCKVSWHSCAERASVMLITLRVKQQVFPSDACCVTSSDSVHFTSSLRSSHSGKWRHFSASTSKQFLHFIRGTSSVELYSANNTCRHCK